MNPYKIKGPAVISFSGGRTSGYMLYHIIQAGLEPDVHICFANTGKECDETLDFVHEIEIKWNVPIVWLEYKRTTLPKYRSEERKAAAAKAREVCGHSYTQENTTKEPGYIITDYTRASRNGEPFENLIDMVALPSVTMRLCTQEMKIRPIKKYMRSKGYDHWDNVVGIRADEPKRVARMRNDKQTYWDNHLPLADAGVDKPTVLAFWKAHPFDLKLPLDENGDTYGGNCDLCFLKASGKRARIAELEPQRVVWWIKQEERTGMTFRPHGQKYIDLLSDPKTCTLDDDLGDCICHD